MNHPFSRLRMNKRALIFGLALIPISLTVGAAAVPAGAAVNPTGAVGHVYVNDNTAGTNTIAAFDRHADGSLSPVPGSPFAAGGAGTGKGLASQGAIQLSSDGRYLVAVDAGSSEISVLKIKQDGGLMLPPNGVTSSGGLTPVSV